MHRIVSKITTHWHYFAMALLTLAFYYPFLLPGMGCFAGGDFFSYHTPFRIAMAMRLQAGDIPLRAGELFGGYPIFQDPQFALLYPINLLFALLMPPPETQELLDFYLLINVMLYSLSAIYFARSFAVSRIASVVAACVACFNGFMVIHVTHINMVQVLTTSLVAAGLLCRYHKNGARNFRFALAAAFALAAGNLAGHPQTTLYAHYVIVVLAFVWATERWRQSRQVKSALPILLATAAACALGIALAAVQLIPTAALLAGSTRALVQRHAVMWSPISLRQLPVFLFPGFYQQLPWQLGWPLYTLDQTVGSPDNWFYWMNPFMTECNVPIGMAATVLALVGWLANWRRWQVQVLGIATLFLLGCATGEDLPFYGWLYDFLPGIRLVRVSTRILIIFFPAMAMLSALGVDTLRQDGRQATHASRRAFAILCTLLLIWGLWIYLGRKDSWIDTWLHAFADKHTGELAMRQYHKQATTIMAALTRQLIIAVIFLVGVAAALLMPMRRPRWHLVVLLGIMALEIILYNFGSAASVNYPGVVTTKSPVLQTVKPPPLGRVVAHSGLNEALHMGIPLANGYTVTIDDWVTAFQPDTMPPWRLGVQRRLLDLWNVSDVIIMRNPHEVQVDGKPVVISDWGWSEIGAPWVPESGETSVTTRALMPSRMDLDFETTRPIASLHLIAFSGRANNEPDGREIARVTALGTDDIALTSAPVLLGRHVSDPRYPLPGLSGTPPTHSRAPFSYYRYIGEHWSSDVTFYDAALDLATTQPITRLKVEATGLYSTTLAIVSIVAILDDGSVVAHDPVNTEGFHEVPTHHPFFRLLHRDDPPGYVHTVPTAIAGSYKKTENIIWRMFNGDSDPLHAVILDKREFKEKDIQTTNAPHPSAFQGTANITWSSPQKATIETHTNQQGWLSLSYSYDPGWSARVDGKLVKVLRNNGPFMAIPIPGGTHTVTMRYIPKGLLLGLLISVGALLIILIAWISSSRSVNKNNLSN